MDGAHPEKADCQASREGHIGRGDERWSAQWVGHTRPVDDNPFGSDERHRYQLTGEQEMETSCSRGRCTSASKGGVDAGGSVRGTASPAHEDEGGPDRGGEGPSMGAGERPARCTEVGQNDEQRNRKSVESQGRRGCLSMCCDQDARRSPGSSHALDAAANDKEREGALVGIRVCLRGVDSFFCYSGELPLHDSRSVSGTTATIRACVSTCRHDDKAPN
mmetsp:Transcript_34396/g.83664  ORF Transcript_34396/g.83664 Transcript_34396/m.83664 type:complete len:219 (+) Transcript_34396:40-696(+)